MEVEITKQMIDELFDFIEGRRIKKEQGGVVLRGVRGAKFPASLLIEPSEESPLTYYMDGIEQKHIAEKFNVSNRTSTFQKIKAKYARQIELYWTFTLVMDFLKPVLEMPIEEIFPKGEKQFDSAIVLCYQYEIMTVGDFLTSFVRYEVVTMKRRLRIAMFIDTIFGNIRETCYGLL